jgi:hypothetical protein
MGIAKNLQAVALAKCLMVCCIDSDIATVSKCGDGSWD